MPLFRLRKSNSCLLSVLRSFDIYLILFSAGRSGSLTLSRILVFVTSAYEEPLLGFKIQPSTVFCKVTKGFLPTANTSVNSLNLPKPNSTIKLPETVDLLQTLWLSIAMLTMVYSETKTLFFLHCVTMALLMFLSCQSSCLFTEIEHALISFLIRMISVTC